MDFVANDLQVELADGMRRLCEGRFPLDAVRSCEGSVDVVDRSAWRELAEAGVFSMLLPEDRGGLGLGLADAACVFEVLGAHLVPGPLVASAVAAACLASADTGAPGAVELAGVPDGSAVAAWLPGAGPGAPSGVLPAIAEHVASADVLLGRVPDGIGVWRPGDVEARALERPMDPLTPVSAIESLGAPAGVLPMGPEAVLALEALGSVLAGAVQVGLAAWSCELAVEYAKGRVQFGRPIGSFQAVKHLCADMVVRVEVARAAVQAAAVTTDQPDVGDPVRAAAGAKLLADEAAVANGKTCIQVHGGMGFTWEVPAHLAYKRARVTAGWFGNATTADEVIESTFAG